MEIVQKGTGQAQDKELLRTEAVWACGELLLHAQTVCVPLRHCPRPQGGHFASLWRWRGAARKCNSTARRQACDECNNGADTVGDAQVHVCHTVREQQARRTLAFGAGGPSGGRKETVKVAAGQAGVAGKESVRPCDDDMHMGVIALIVLNVTSSHFYTMLALYPDFHRTYHHHPVASSPPPSAQRERSACSTLL